MNITGEDATYLTTIISNFAPMRSEDLTGMVFNRTLYFIVNWCILYEIDLPDIISPDLTCCFWRNFENLGSFAYDNIIIDKPELFNIIVDKLRVLEYTKNNIVYANDNCLEDQQFDTLSKYRPDDGSMKFYIDGSLKHRSFTMINKSMFKLNKADTMSLVVYDANYTEYSRLLYKFILFKKKYNRFINIYILTLDLHDDE